jgi:N utilization substance protein A
MDLQRQERIRELIQRAEALTDRDKLRIVGHVGPRTLQALEDANYRSVDDLAREDPDRLALRTGLGVKKAKAVRDAAKHFLAHELNELMSARTTAKQQRDVIAPDLGPASDANPATNSEVAAEANPEVHAE